MELFKDKKALNPYIGAVICFGVAILAFMYAILHRSAPGQLFPFMESGIVIAFVIWGLMCVHQARALKKSPSSPVSVAVIGILVSASACSVFLGIVLDAYTPGLSWKENPATVIGLPFYLTSCGQRHYTVEYQYMWKERAFHGATDARFGLPPIANAASHSFEVRPLAIGDSITVKVNPDHSEQSLFPQSPTVLIYPGFLLFFLLGVFSFYRWKNPPKQGRYL
ncbi:hypothetical protein KBB27_04590 [Patescibacteria group bacterium]|nr:hypothetical protein [Patescibacteria group bacterium]